MGTVGWPVTRAAEPESNENQQDVRVYKALAFTGGARRAL